MQLPNVATVAWAVQGDQLSRQIVATLVDGSAPWNPLTVYNGVVRYKKPDGTIGVYDTDEDGNRAVTWSGNVATIKIVQQALTVPGTVIMQLDFYDSTDARVSTFGWCTNVQPAVVTDTEFLSTDYYNILTLQIAAVLGISNFKYMIANEESTSTATMAHAVGDYFILDNILYITTSAIAIGETIIPGTNCEAAVIGDDLTEVKDTLNQLDDDVDAVETALSNIGTVVAGTNAASLEVTPNTYTPVSSLVLDAGTWILLAGNQWSSSFTELCIAELFYPGIGAVPGTTIRYGGVGSGGGVQTSAILQLSSQTTIGYRVYQTSSSSKTASSVSLIAIRIA